MNDVDGVGRQPSADDGPRQRRRTHHITSHWDDRCRPRRPLYPRNECLSYDFI